MASSVRTPMRTVCAHAFVWAWAYVDEVVAQKYSRLCSQKMWRASAKEPCNCERLHQKLLFCSVARRICIQARCRAHTHLVFVEQHDGGVGKSHALVPAALRQLHREHAVLQAHHVLLKLNGGDVCPAPMRSRREREVRSKYDRYGYSDFHEIARIDLSGKEISLKPGKPEFDRNLCGTFIHKLGGF